MRPGACALRRQVGSGVPAGRETPMARLLVDPPAPGDWNMAVDEMLLDAAAAGEGPCLRLYQWAEATLSLGYFQSCGQRAAHAPSRACPLVRRLSGGGAIVHDRELTYSLAVPAGHGLGRASPRLYAQVHATLIAALRTLGVAASLHGAQDAAEPFLCFQRRTEADVVVEGGKIAGSAQRRRRGAVLQHGSILLAASPAAPELPGIKELCSVAITPQVLGGAWLPELARGLEVEWIEDRLSDVQRQRAERLRAGRYATEAWNFRRP